MFFRPDLESTLQPMNSNLPEEIVPPTAGSLRPCRGPSQITDGLGARGHSARLEICAKHVRTAPTRGTMQPFSGFSKCRLGVSLCLVADFLLGDVDGSNFSTSTRIEARATLLAGYLQDDWKVNRRFNLNLGMRYEYLRPFQDKYNKFVNFDIDTDPQHPALVLGGQVGKSKFINSDPNNFQPRVGLAYQLIPEKFVVRAGYGIYYPLA